MATPSFLIEASNAGTSAMPHIIMLDCSGSIRDTFPNKDKDSTVIKVIEEKILPQLLGGTARVRFVCWNSDFHNDGALSSDKKSIFDNTLNGGKGGVYLPPAVVPRESLKIFFAHIGGYITKSCLTFPHLAFENVPAEWINKKGPTHIWFVTDGAIGWPGISAPELKDYKSRLARSMCEFFARHVEAQLHIVTVEPQLRDYGSSESLVGAAGTDVWAVVSENKLSRHIAEFVSYNPATLAGGFVQFKRVVSPPGHLPFGKYYFSELRIGEFIQYVRRTIREWMQSVHRPKETKEEKEAKEEIKGITKEECENKLLALVQNLSATLAKLTEKKPPKLVSDIVNTFCRLFAHTPLDSSFVRLILTESIEKQAEGSAEVFAAYRTRLKDLFKRADDMLMDNVYNALAIDGDFVTLPAGNLIVAGSNPRLVQSDIVLLGKTYRRAALKITKEVKEESGGVLVLPVIPTNASKKSPLNQQCLRQWSRAILGRQYGLPPTHDLHLFLSLAILLRVMITPEIDPLVKGHFREWAITMWRKKSAHADITEIERLQAGELPLPNNGKLSDLHKLIDRARELVCPAIGEVEEKKTALRSMSLWYLMCLALDGDEPAVAVKQYIHCRESLAEDFPDGKALVTLQNYLEAWKRQPGCLPPLAPAVQVPFSVALDYSECLITLEDTSATGGFMFLPALHNPECSPVYVLSATGYSRLMAEGGSPTCPICFSPLTTAHFAPVGPRQDDWAAGIFMAVSASATKEIKTETDAKAHKRPQDDIELFAKDMAEATRIRALHSRIESSPSHAEPTETKSELPAKCALIFMRGTTGSGKSTLALQIETLLTAKGYRCVVTGTDKYYTMGGPASQAMVKLDIEHMKMHSAKRKAIILDTCGVDIKNPVFGVDLTNWQVVEAWPNLQDHKDMEGYYAWSLKNVLVRPSPSGPSDNWNLCPPKSSLKTCISVHHAKSMALFSSRGKAALLGKLPLKSSKSQPLPTLEECIRLLDPKANAYAKNLRDVVSEAQAIVSNL